MAKASKMASDAVSGKTETVEAVLKNGTEAFRERYEKAVADYDRLLGFNKETVIAYALAVNAAGKGAESLHNELYAFSKQAARDSIANTTKLLDSKSADEAFELQSDIAMTAFQAYMTEVAKVSEIMVSTTKSAFEPFQGRVRAWMDAVHAARAS
jgi:phasin family protein